MARRTYQKGSVYLSGKRNPAWYGRWRDTEVGPDGKLRRPRRNVLLGYKRDIPTKRLAMRELEKRLADINSPTFRPLQVATFREFADKWTKEILPTTKPSNQSSALSHLRTSLSLFNGFALRDIQLSALQSFVAGLTANPKTIRNYVTTLRSIWTAARKQGYVSHDPFDGLALPRLVKAEQRFFTEEEMVRIIDAAEEPHKTFYWLAAETGMRAGELCGLRWQDVDLDGCVVQVRQSTWRGRVGDPKTARGVRAFPISPELSAHLRARGVEVAGLSFVFRSRKETPWDANLVVKRHLHPLLAKLGIERAGLHAFRHGNETVMDRERTPLAVRLSRLGHADTRMMMNYSHVVSEDDRKIAGHFGKLFGPKWTENQKGLQDALPVTPRFQ